MTGHAIISGAGIAGPALAHQLGARGWRTTVIERFPERRDEGQNVDVRGAAREVARRMGIEADLRAANTGEVGMRFVTDDGSPAASFPMSAPGEVDGPTAEFEILRGELSRILIDHSRHSTEYRFDTRISDLTDHGDHVTVALDDGTAVDADLVVIAEGLRSKTRRFVTSADVNDLGMYFAYVTLPREDTDDQWWNWQHAPGSLAVHLRPDNLGTTRALLTFISDVRGLEALRPADQIAILRKTFADVGGAAPRILDAPRRGRAALLLRRRPGEHAGVEQGPHRPARRRRVLQCHLRWRRHQLCVDRGLRAGRRAVPHRGHARRTEEL